MNAVLTGWLLEAVVVTALLLLGASALYGLALLIAPQRALALARFFNRQFSSRRALRPLEIPRPSERFFYRHHRWVGGLLLLGVALFFLLYWLEFPRENVLAALARRYGNVPGGTLYASLETFFLVANAIIGVLALIILLRPSLLKPIEAFANRWVSTRRALRGLDVRHESLDEMAARHPRLMGALILAGVIYVTFGLVVAIA